MDTNKALMLNFITSILKKNYEYIQAYMVKQIVFLRLVQI